MTRHPLALLALAAALTAGLGACSSHTSDSESEADSGASVEAGDGGVVVHDDEDVIITGDEVVETRACTGQDVQVTGSNCKCTFTGTCGEVTIVGADNEVSLENVTSITLMGSNNTVTWRGKEPEISNIGTDNQITRAK